ncbi:estrogen receptor 2b [Syngnathoides biaculeatus]|uniref:estrogen receptor 2b n=1 Tax=Syngnathoides biaculeatus TaxID=300417 RepID=UPI002ADDAD3C|nr:estrogen receptor 2b [Syngnathoides biaculeatus]
MADRLRSASSPGLGSEPLALVQLQEVDSSETSALHSSPLPTPAIYSPPVGLNGGHVVCVSSPYADGDHEYGHATLAFYGSSALSYGQAPAENAPSAFWSEPPLAVRRPPCFAHGHAAPHLMESKAPGANSGVLACSKIMAKRSEGGVCCSGAKSDTHFCAVCHDYASGYHYGVWSCEGCKAFFKRSIQGHNDYICPATNQCTIDKNRRKSCQACRLRKCYEVGMMKFGVRRERCSYRGVRQHRRGTPQPRVLARAGVGPAARAGRHVHPEAPLAPQMSPEEFIARIVEAEPPDIYLMEELKKPFTEASMMTSLTNLADKELVLMISWAKKIPGFVELSLCDQIQLLKCCWLEILMLGLMWRSVDHPGKLIFSPDFKVNREEGECVEGITEIFDMLLAATSRFRELKLQREEYVCLKAMILLNSNICTNSPQTAEEFASRKKLLRLLDLVIDALVWSISKSGLSSKQQTLRLGHLTMLLSHIRHVSNKGMDHLSNMKRKNVVLVYDLLLEMLEANTSGGSQMSGVTASDAYGRRLVCRTTELPSAGHARHPKMALAHVSDGIPW